jgi:hypothetical protein
MNQAGKPRNLFRPLARLQIRLELFPGRFASAKVNLFYNLPHLFPLPKERTNRSQISVRRKIVGLFTPPAGLQRRLGRFAAEFD